MGGNGNLTEAVMLDNWIRALTCSGPFPIPCIPVGTSVLDLDKEGRGVLYCWTHVPLVEIPLRLLLQLGHRVDFIVAHPGKIVGKDEFIVPGLKERIKTLSVDQRVLTKVRTALKQGRSVACLVDPEMFGPISSQILSVAGGAKAFVVFQWAERHANGDITVVFRPAPHPLCENDQEIQENLNFLKNMNQKALHAVGVVLDD